jgi:UDP-N-acetylglucosamine:LPS N-acetylglucosamine transferase
MSSTRPRRILILYADYGSGHRSASNAVQAALEQIYGDHVITAMVNPIDDRAAPKFLKREQTRYDRRVTETPQLYKLAYDIGDMSVTTNIMESAMIVLLHEAIRKAIDAYTPDAIVNTYPLFCSPLSGIYTISRQYIPTITVVTDFTNVNKLWFNSVSELTVVPTDNTRQSAIDQGLDPQTVRLCGIPVHPSIANERRSKEQIRKELGWTTGMTTALVVGSKRVKRLPEMLHALNHSALPVQLGLVAGGDERLYSTFSETDWHLAANMYNRVENIPTLMHASDLIVCKAGGLITSEALAAGLPLLYVDLIQGQETGNLEYIVQEGAGELASDPVKVLEILFHWLAGDQTLLRERAANARRIGRPRAAFDVAELAFQAAATGARPVDKKLVDFSRLTALLDRFEVPWSLPAVGRK